jgi:alpha-D-ribose 1-methylphosphonate 5-triphosphate diphosphatase
MGAVKLGLEGGDMAAAIRMVTARPAAAAGLTDRGEIAAGKAADLVRFRVSGGFPVIRAVWARGQVV